MEHNKTFLEIFTKYEPSEEKRSLLLRSTECAVRYAREARRVEVELTFLSHEDAELIYQIEDECRELYSLVSFKILPHFPESELQAAFNARFSEVCAEAALCGAVTTGFFANADFQDTGDEILIKIPFHESGVAFVRAADTENILSAILKSRYGATRRIRITTSENLAEYEAAREARYNERLIAAEEESRRRSEELRRENTERELERRRAEDPQFDFDAQSRIPGVASEFCRMGEGDYKVGASRYSLLDMAVLWGEEISVETEPTPIEAAGQKGNVLILGTVFEVGAKETRAGDKQNITIGISDGAGAIYVKKTLQIEECAWVKGIKPGAHLAVLGRVLLDKFDGERILSPRGISKIKRVEREDTSAEKRVELHLHTNMSQMDALITPEELVNTAIRWGHKAIAVTDHGNVQAFPEVMLALEKSKNEELKILYGMEAYFVNDTARCVFGTRYPAFDDEMIVFDIETTGLSSRACKIIEIGAVKIRSGEVIERFDTFVDPGEHIPEKITALTSITDEMVRGAPHEAEAVRAFLDFAGDRLLVAHNASFDVGFIRAAADRCGYEFSNTYLDTVGLSKYVNSELKNHKLDTIAAYYKLGDFNHHRASDDAEVLAKIFFEMLSRLRSEGIGNFVRMQDAMSEKTDPLKLPTYHMIIFAKNRAGLKNLYKLISSSYLDYFGGTRKRYPRIPKTLIDENREGLIIGSACEAGELYRAILEGRSEAELEEIVNFYDYLEIQPTSNNLFLIDKGEVASEEGIRDINRKICALGEKYGKPVCATCDAHFLNKEDEIYRRVILAGMKFPDADKELPIYLRTTEEMLAEFAYLGEEKAREVVIVNPNRIADECEKIRPIPEGRYEPSLEGATEELTESCWRRAHEWYGDELPEIVERRLEKELNSIIKNGFAVLYMIAVKLVAYSESLGYLVGSRGSVGSSFVATMSGISEVNPLPPHYRCPKCRYSEFYTDGSVGSGFDLPDKACPKCGTPLYGDGHDIPFETFLGFYGDKSPDIDLNFSGDVQGRVHKYTEDLFGKGQVFRAGTIGTLASKTAWGYASKYLEERRIRLPKAAVSYMTSRLVGIKKTTGQHPGGIIVVPREYDISDFTPVQHPADDAGSDVITTHFQFSYLHDTILKLDELGHDMPTKYKMLEKYTNTSVLDVKMNDETVYELFRSVAPLGIDPSDIGGCKLGTFGIPEMGTRFIQQVLIDAKPKNFADLLQISGLTHGTDVWLGNAQDLIKEGICTISEVVGTRDGIMLYLIRHGLDDSTSFKIMEDVRKGKGLKPEYEAAMREHDVPDWYIGSCKKIKYMFPKAHAAAYVMSAIRLCWYKIYYPMEFYAAFLSVAPGGFDAEIVSGGYKKVSAKIRELEEKGTEATQKEAEQLTTLQLVREALSRGVEFLPVDLYKSDAAAFLPEGGKIRMPLNSLPGLGDTAAAKIAEVREKYEIYSVEDLRLRTGISKAVIEILRNNGALAGLSETNQFSLF